MHRNGELDEIGDFWTMFQCELKEPVPVAVITYIGSYQAPRAINVLVLETYHLGTKTTRIKPGAQYGYNGTIPKDINEIHQQQS